MHDSVGLKPMMRMLIVIVDWEQKSNLKKILNNSSMRFCYITKAEGTASSEILDMFGLGQSDKAFAFCILPQALSESLMKQISRLFLMQRKGNGIAFTIPLSGIAANIGKILNEDAKERMKCHMDKMEKEAEKMRNETSLCLIITILNVGYSEDLMDVAKAAGASGGTVIHARRAGDHEHLNFLGLSIQEEQEMLFIIANRDNKKDIMKAINKEFGARSEAHGITISLPVDSATGLEVLLG